MVKRKNYDSPFDKEEYESLEKQTILENEFLENTEFNDEFYEHAPSHISPSYPLYLWQSSFLTNSIDEEKDAYDKYKEIEGLE